MAAWSPNPDVSSRAMGSGVAGSDGVAPSGPVGVVISGEDWLDAVCPFLRASDGSWRSASPVRDHRCWATDPPSELPVLTQQRLCLNRSHDGCERFLHARELRSSAWMRDRSNGQAAATTPPASPDGQGRVDRTWRLQEALVPLVARPRLVLAAAGVGLMVLLLAVLTWGNAGDHARSSPPPVPPSGMPRSAAPSAEPGMPSPGPDGMRRYRIREGDTLRTIADRFGVSVRQIRAVNDLGDPPRLVVGEVVLIPPAG